MAVWAAVGSAVDCLEAEAWAEEAVEAAGMEVAEGAVAVLEVVVMASVALAVMVGHAALQSSQGCTEEVALEVVATAPVDWVVSWADMEARRRAGMMAGVVGLRLVPTEDGEGIYWVFEEGTAAEAATGAGR